MMDCARIVDRILSQGDPRSDVYREGMLAAFRLRRTGVAIPRPYEMGSLAADAYYSGTQRGHDEWPKVLESRIGDCSVCGTLLLTGDKYTQWNDGKLTCCECKR